MLSLIMLSLIIISIIDSMMLMVMPMVMLMADDAMGPDDACYAGPPPTIHRKIDPHDRQSPSAVRHPTLTIHCLPLTFHCLSLPFLQLLRPSALGRYEDRAPLRRVSGAWRDQFHCRQAEWRRAEIWKQDRFKSGINRQGTSFSNSSFNLR